MRSQNFRWLPRGKPFQPDLYDSDDEFPPILRHLIRERGFPDGDELESFLHPKLRDLSDPFLIPEMDLAVERILEAIDQKQEICVYGDYDVDGVASITLMCRILESYGLSPRSFIPHRSQEGYGLSDAALRRCMAEGPRPDLLITVDCGTVSTQEVALLAEQGIDVVIVDHHEPTPGCKPASRALVNPKCGSEFGYLCAAGVVFKLGHALFKTRPSPLDLRELIDLVAIATIADIVPMLGENRLLVRHGLERLPKSRNIGLKALQKVTRMNGRASSMDVGFRIGPRLNAAGRMDVPEDALKTLICRSEEVAMTLASKLDEHNRARQEHENQIRREAAGFLETRFNPDSDPVIVLGSREWHPGVVGIVASRLMRQYHKPTFLISIDSEGVGKGSGRSIEGVSLVEALRACEDCLIAGGGHAMAAGLSIREEEIDRFREQFAAYVLAHTDMEQRSPTLWYDAEIEFDQLSLDFLAEYELLQPFGNGNPQPIFLTRNVYLSRRPLHMKNHHLRLHLRQGIKEQDAVYFGGGEQPLPDPPWDIAFTIDRNTFRGRTSLQIIIQDIRKSHPSP